MGSHHRENDRLTERNMKSSSDDDSDFSDWEVEERAEKIYKELKEKNLLRKNSDGKLRCPYCLGKKKQDYRYKDLLQHASGVGKSKKNLKQAARHIALEKFLQMDFEEKSSPSYVASLSDHGPPKRQKVERAQERFVWPWMGIVVNIPVKDKYGASLATASKLKELFARFNPVKSHPLWDYRGFRGVAIIEFSKDFSGYHDANSFERWFEADHHGKRDWMELRRRSSSMFGWIARETDYEGEDKHIRDHLRKHGDLKTVNELQNEEKRKKDLLVDELKQEIDTKNMHLQRSGEMLSEVTYVLNQTRSTLAEKECHIATLIDQYNEERRRSERKQHDLWMELLEERKTWSIELEKEKEKLAKHHSELQQREAENEYEMKKLEEERKKNAARDANLQVARKEHVKAEESLMELLEVHKREKEEAYKKISEMQKKLEDKQNLELEIEMVKGKIQMLEHMGGDDVTTKMETMMKELEEKESDLKDMEDLQNTLVKKERIANDELVDARKEAIAGFEDLFSNRAHIGIKRMGELDSKAFKEEYMKRDPKAYESGAIQIVLSEWEAHLRDSSWYPFKVIQDGDKITEIIDENDEKLKGLKADCGEGVFNAVVCALKELNEYNPSGRYPVKVLWNLKEGRSASLKEAIQHLVKNCKKSKNKR